MPFVNRELGTKAEEMPCSKEGQKDSAVRVLERDDKRGSRGFGGKSLIANLHKAMGLQHGKRLQHGVMLGVTEGDHKAGPHDQLQPS